MEDIIRMKNFFLFSLFLFLYVFTLNNPQNEKKKKNGVFYYIVIDQLGSVVQ